MKIDLRTFLIVTLLLTGCAHSTEPYVGFQQKWSQDLHGDEPKGYWRYVSYPYGVTPEIGGGFIFAGVQRGDLIAVEENTSKVVFKTKTTRLVGQPLYVAANTNHGAWLVLGDEPGIRVIDVATHNDVWSFSTQELLSPAHTVSGSMVYFTSPEGSIYAFNTEGGQPVLLWKYTYSSVLNPEYSIQGMMNISINGNTLYAGMSDGTIVALNKDTGLILWQNHLGLAHKATYASAPIWVNNILYAISNTEGVYALDPSDGSPLWRYRAPDLNSLIIDEKAQRMIAVGKNIIISLDLEGNLVWSQDIIDPALLNSPGVWRSGAIMFGFAKGSVSGALSTPILWQDYILVPTAKTGPFWHLKGIVALRKDNGAEVSSFGKRLWRNMGKYYGVSTNVVLKGNDLYFVDRYGIARKVALSVKN